MDSKLLQTSGAPVARQQTDWRGGASLPRPTSSRCRTPSSPTVATAAAPTRVRQQVAHRGVQHADQQQQQRRQQEQHHRWRSAERHPHHAGLASYRFRIADVDCRWLEAVVREAVVHLAQAPFLQVTQTSRGAVEPSFSCVPLPGTNSLSSQTWHDLTRQLTAQRDAESFLYLAPLQPSPARPTPQQFDAANSARQRPRHAVLTGIEQKPLLRGRVGDCCDDEVTHSDGPAATAGAMSQILPYVHAARSEARSRQGTRGDRRLTEGAARALREGSTAVQAEWGLVLQSRLHEALNGCYILRTSTSGEPGCDCTHFSVVRAQEGQGVTEQILSAWRT